LYTSSATEEERGWSKTLSSYRMTLRLR